MLSVLCISTNIRSLLYKIPVSKTTDLSSDAYSVVLTVYGVSTSVSHSLGDAYKL